MQDIPAISVIIPVHNEEDMIAKCLASLEDLHYLHDKLEIILINDGSKDDTGNIIKSQVKKLPYIYLETDGVGPSKARNIGIKKAHGELIAFTDADCTVDIEWLNELLKGFTTKDIAGVGGSQDIPDDAIEFERKVHVFLSSMHFICDYIKTGDIVRPVDHIASCNAIYKRDVIEEVDGFDERLWPGEDVDLDYKIRHRGYKIMHNPKAIVAHHRPANLRMFFGMMKRYGQAQAYLVRKYGVFRKLHYVPFTGFLLFSGWILVILYNLYWGVVFAFGVFLITASTFFLKYGLKVGFDNFIMFVMTMAGWNIGFGWGFIKRSPR